MTDAEKLFLIADWVDSEFPNDPNPQVQTDLRSIARKLTELDDLLNAGLKKADEDIHSGEPARELAGKMWLVWFAMLREVLLDEDKDAG